MHEPKISLPIAMYTLLYWFTRSYFHYWVFIDGYILGNVCNYRIEGVAGLYSLHHTVICEHDQVTFES